MALLLSSQKINGAGVTDNFGQIYSYISTLNEWIQDGATYSNVIVSYNQNGLVTPQIINLLEQIEAAQADDRLDGVKIGSNVDAYWYYLINPDKLLKIRVENDSTLRVELDQNKLTRLILSRTRCKGAKGVTGVIGPDGIPGQPGPNEITFTPTIQNASLLIDQEVPTPLATPISVRIYDGTTLQSEVKYDLGTKALTFTTAGVTLNPTSTLALTNNILTGTLIRSDGQPWPSTTRFKARQVGPTGEAGSDGSTFISTISSSVSDPSVSATSAVKVMRRSQQADIHYITATIGDTIPVIHLRSNSDTSQITISSTIGLGSTPRPDRWAAVEPTISDAKSIAVWSLNSDDPTKVTDVVLDLPTFVPLQVVGYGGWTGFKEADEIQCCQESLFTCLTPLACPTEYVAYNTGQQFSGTIGVDAIDIRWTITGGTSSLTAYVTQQVSEWPTPKDNSNYISISPFNTSDPAATPSNRVPFNYTTSVIVPTIGTQDIKCFIAADLRVSDILVNGISSGATGLEFTGTLGIVPVTIPIGSFTAIDNIVEFILEDDGIITGLLVVWIH